MTWPPDENIEAEVQPWLSKPRFHPIQIITLHSTRGPTTEDLQYQATRNWMQSLGNVGDRDSEGKPIWGSSTNRIIGSAGQMCVAVPDDRYCTYGAGFGDPSSWAVDFYAINIELAQATVDQPFTDATLERCAQVCADLCRQYSIPAIWLERVDQTGEVPSGITSHDLTDNGKKLGKTDVGARFPYAWFMYRVKELLMPDDLKALVERLEALVAGNGIKVKLPDGSEQSLAGEQALALIAAAGLSVVQYLYNHDKALAELEAKAGREAFRLFVDRLGAALE